MTTKLRFPRILTLLSLSTLVVGAAGCSNGQSPTEPASFDTPVAASAVAVSGDKRHGADDPAGDDRGGRQGRGNDDPAGDNRGGRGRGRGGNNGGNNGGNQQRPPRAGVEREGTVTSVAAGTLVLASGQRIVVNAQTQWDSRGDLLSLQQVAAAVNAGRPTRAEARGTVRADGALVAQTVKAEVDQ
ncbi:MAG TPA: DUF5666 domain-containing protein [Thermoanaerobaculia bacterium]|jgi:hypothetical protein|nr:DUF5666 domain-containing protein [Thermoanaerobaculia bacterium]